MKRVYSKPDIVFEDFTLSTNIAASCSVKTYTQAANTCGYSVDLGAGLGTVNAFLSGVSACSEWPVSADGEFGLCYHVPYSSNSLFVS